MTEARPADRPFPWVLLLILVGAGFAAYSRTFSAPFVFDDPDSILRNPTLRHLGDLRAVLSPPYDQGQTVAGRPVLNLSFALNYALSGTAVWSYHVVNLLIHVAAGLTLWGILRRVFRGRASVAWATALLWSLHPLQTESVTYVAQRAESLMGCFYLLTVYGYLRYAENQGGRPRAAAGWAVLSVGACALGMATKEVMVSAPLAVLLYDRTFLSGSFRAAWRRHAALLLSLATCWGLLAVLVASTHGRGGTSGLGLGVAWTAYVLTQFPGVLHYLRLVVWPHPLVFDYGAEWMNWAQVWPSAVLVTALAAASVWLLFRRTADFPAPPDSARGAGFAGVIFFALLAPTSLVPGIRQTWVEHRMYLALAPVLAVGVGGLHALWVRRKGANDRLGQAALFTAAALLLALTFQRNRLYGSELGLWETTVAVRPQNPYAHNDLGDLLQQNGRFAEAGIQFQEALRLKPDLADGWNNWGNILRRDGKPQAALAAFRRALALKPRYPEADNNLGVALTDLGQLDLAVAAFRAALQLTPEYEEAWFNLGVALAREQRWPDAISAYEAALRLQPDAVPCRLNLGNAWAGWHRYDKAQAEFEQALRLRPDYAEAHFNLANTLALAGQFAQAEGEYEATLRLQPDFAPARENLRRVRALRSASP